MCKKYRKYPGTGKISSLMRHCDARLPRSPLRGDSWVCGCVSAGREGPETERERNEVGIALDLVYRSFRSSGPGSPRCL